MGKVETTHLLTNIIHEKFSKSFKKDQIKYRVDKFSKLTYEQVDKDAYLFVRLVSKDEKIVQSFGPAWIMTTASKDVYIFLRPCWSIHNISSML